MNLLLKRTVTLASMVLVLGCAYFAAPNSVHAAQQVWNGPIDGSPMPGVKKLYPYPAWTSTPFMCVFNCVPASYPAGMATGFALEMAIDLDGQQFHGTNPDSQTWAGYPPGSTSFFWNVHRDQLTANRVCSLVDSTSTGSVTSSGSYNSPQDNQIIRYGQTSPVWVKARANDAGNSYIRNLICSTNALPDNSLSAAPTAIRSGESSTLSFDGGPNYEAQDTICTTTNFTIPTHTRYDFGWQVLVGGAAFFGGPDTTTYQYMGAPSYGNVQVADTSGSITVSPTVTTTYTYSCTNGNGTTVKTATVCVDTCSTPAADVTFSAAPASIPAGSSSSLTWTSTNATSCSSATFATGSATSGSVAVSPSTTTTYSISCTGPGGSSAVKYATVTIASGSGTVTSALSASPSSIATGAFSTLTWSSTNANSCNGTGFQTKGATSGSVSTGALTSTTNYSIICSRPGTGTGTWTLVNSDISDMTCPFTTSDPYSLNVYNGTPTCSDASPSGKACALPASDCKINTMSTSGGCYIYTDIYTCSGGTQTTPPSTAGAAATVTVSSGANLTAGSITPISATAGTAVSLSSTITNNGTASTGTSFTDVFQVAADASGTGATAIGTFTSGIPNGFPAGYGEPNANVSYTFTTAGTKYVRACADNNASFVGAIAESNENDNCGAWTAVTVTSPPVTSCTVSPSSLASVPGSVTWSAVPSTLGSYTWAPSEGGAPGGTGANLARTYSTVGTYGMSVTAGGATVSCPNITAGAVCGTASPTLTANPTRVVSDATVVLTVRAGGVDSTCTLTGPGVSRTFTPTSCNVAQTTVTTPAITNQSVYTLSCDGGERTAQAVVNIIPKVQEF